MVKNKILNLENPKDPLLQFKKEIEFQHKWLLNWKETSSSCCGRNIKHQVNKLKIVEPTCFFYLELITGFGYVAVFASCYPLAPLLFWLCNLCDLNYLKLELLYTYKRINPIGAQNIGAWNLIMKAVMISSVFTNSMYIVFVSNFMDYLDLVE